MEIPNFLSWDIQIKVIGSQKKIHNQDVDTGFDFSNFFVKTIRYDDQDILKYDN